MVRRSSHNQFISLIVYHCSIAHTTRYPREDEEDGQHYRHVTQDTMDQLIDKGAFIQTCRCVLPYHPSLALTGDLCSLYGHMYGLTTDAVDHVARARKIGVITMELEVRSSLQ